MLRKSLVHALHVFFLLAMLTLQGTPVAAQGRPVERSFDEFLAAQGTFCVPDGEGGCFLFFGPFPNFLGWEDEDNMRGAVVDYAGVVDKWLQDQSGGSIQLGTTVTGWVLERPSDFFTEGGVEITVHLEFSRALTFGVAGLDPVADPLFFGSRAEDVLAGAPAALADGFLTVRYLDQAAGQPLRDLVQVLVFPEVGSAFVSEHFNADADGLLREASGVADGTPGKLKIRQIGDFVPEVSFPLQIVGFKIDHARR